MSNSGLSLAGASVDNPADRRRRRNDLTLLIFASVFVLFDQILSYIGLHDNNVSLVWISGILALLVTGCVALLLIFRIITLKLFESPLLPVSVVTLAGQLMIGRAVDQAIDLCRLFSNYSFYVRKVDASDSSPRFVTFDWGSSGFAGYSASYYLLFDETGHAANPPSGTISTADTFLPGPNCSMSISHLWGQFYSLATHC